MPGSLLEVDTSFPDIRGKSQERINREVLDHLFLLNEQLRYTLGNLGRENFNETEFDGIVTYIRTPLAVALEDTNGHVTKLEVRADRTDLSVEDLYGNVTRLDARADGLGVSIEDLYGNVLRLDARADGLVASVSDLDGNITSLTATVLGMRLEVSNGYSSSSITLTANGVGISSQVISFTGTVTFTDLEGEGTTTINGANIKTGTIKAIDIEGCRFICILKADGTVTGRLIFSYLEAVNEAGGIKLDDGGAGDETEGKYRMFLYTTAVHGVTFHLKLYSAGKMSLDAMDLLYAKGQIVNIKSDGDIQLDAKGKLAVTGDTELTGALAVTGDTELTGALAVTGDTELTGALTVETETTLKGAVNVQGLLTAQAGAALNGDVTVGGTALEEYIKGFIQETETALNGKITALTSRVGAAETAASEAQSAAAGVARDLQYLGNTRVYELERKMSALEARVAALE